MRARLYKTIYMQNLLQLTNHLLLFRLIYYLPLNYDVCSKTMLTMKYSCLLLPTYTEIMVSFHKG